MNLKIIASLSFIFHQVDPTSAFLTSAHGQVSCTPYAATSSADEARTTWPSPVRAQTARLPGRMRARLRVPGAATGATAGRSCGRRRWAQTRALPPGAAADAVGRRDATSVRTDAGISQVGTRRLRLTKMYGTEKTYEPNRPV
jgi:hypothetical protein